ncbi:DUF2076 family protein [Prosthecomicrobium sp. N25]|uniref:DUF2076 family protein n=1 Tax=Prosthecomicrobium sp. N25 TaxID=3129254 RepID=UPI003078471C
MSPEEAEIIRDVFERVRRMGPAPRDPAAEAAIERELRANPDSLVGLVRAIVALDRERAHLIEENDALRAELRGGGDSGGGGLFGGGHREDHAPGDRRDPWGRGGDPYGNEPGQPGPGPERPPEPAREPWGSPPWGRWGRPSQSMPPADQAGGPWGNRAPQSPQPPQQGGGALQTVAGAAAGMVGGLFAYEALKGLFGGSGHDGGMFGSAHASEKGGQVASNDHFETGGTMDDGGDFFGGLDDFDVT